MMGIKSNGMILMAESGEGIKFTEVQQDAQPGDSIN